jgi:hypothetical protein
MGEGLIKAIKHLLYCRFLKCVLLKFRQQRGIKMQVFTSIRFIVKRCGAWFSDGVVHLILGLTKNEKDNFLINSDSKSF